MRADSFEWKKGFFSLLSVPKFENKKKVSLCCLLMSPFFYFVRIHMKIYEVITSFMVSDIEKALNGEKLSQLIIIKSGTERHSSCQVENGIFFKNWLLFLPVSMELSVYFCIQWFIRTVSIVIFYLDVFWVKFRLKNTHFAAHDCDCDLGSLTFEPRHFEVCIRWSLCLVAWHMRPHRWNYRSRVLKGKWNKMS